MIVYAKDYQPKTTVLLSFVCIVFYHYSEVCTLLSDTCTLGDKECPSCSVGKLRVLVLLKALAQPGRCYAQVQALLQGLWANAISTKGVAQELLLADGRALVASAAVAMSSVWKLHLLSLPLLLVVLHQVTALKDVRKRLEQADKMRLEDLRTMTGAPIGVKVLAAAALDLPVALIARAMSAAGLWDTGLGYNALLHLFSFLPWCIYSCALTRPDVESGLHAWAYFRRLRPGEVTDMLLAVHWVVDALAVHAISLALPWTSRSISQQIFHMICGLALRLVLHLVLSAFVGRDMKDEVVD